MRLLSTVMGPGRRVARAREVAAGDLAGPRKEVICVKPFTLISTAIILFTCF